MTASKQAVTLLAGALIACTHAPSKPEPAPNLVPAFSEACKRSGYKEGSAEHVACIARLLDQAYPTTNDRRYTCTDLGGGTVSCRED